MKKIIIAILILVGSFIFGAKNASANFLYYNADNFRATFGNTVEAPGLYSSGNAGIGIQPSTAQLLVGAPATVDALKVGSSTTLFIVDKQGFVGIGTAAPGTKLHVANGALRVSGGSLNNWPAGWEKIIELDASGAVIRWANAGTSQYVGIGATTDGTIRFMKNTTDDDTGTRTDTFAVTNAGDVGIGTTSPSQDLHIRKIDDASILLEADTDNTTETDNAFIKLSQDGTNAQAIMGMVGGAGFDPEGNLYSGALDNATLIGTLDSVGSLQLGTNDNVRLTIETTGDVGINTTNPTSKLTVDGDIKVLTSGNGIIFPDNSKLTTANNTGVGSVSNTDTSLTISPTTGAVVASLNLGKANTWTAAQTFSGGANFPNGGVWNTTGVDVSGSVVTRGASAQVTIFDRQGLNTSYAFSSPAAGELRLTDQLGINKLSINSNGDFGIGGITSPAQKLDVAGNIQTQGVKISPTNCDDGQVLKWAGGVGICGADNNSGTIGGGGTTNYIPQFSNATALSNSAIYQISDPTNPSDKRIGIGTIGPYAPFAVGTTSTESLVNIQQNVALNAIQIEATQLASGLYAPGIVWSTSNSFVNRPKAGIWAFMNNQGSDLYFGTSNNYANGITNTALVIDQSANVGIGTTTPSAKLDVFGGDIYVREAGASAFPLFLTEAVSTGGSPHILLRRAQGTALGSESAVLSQDTLGNISFRPHDGAGYLANGSVDIRANAEENFSATAHGSSLRFYTTALQAVSAGERVRIDPAGNVGIGATVTDAQLDVLANSVTEVVAQFRPAAGATADILQVLGSGGLALLTVQPSGNVGIGTTSPANLLHLHKTGATAQTYITLTNGTTGSTASDGLTVGYDGTGSGRAVVWNREATGLELATNNTSRVIIDSSGNVGIGVSPTAKLHVGGISGTDGIRFPDGTLQKSAAVSGAVSSVASGDSSLTISPTTGAVVASLNVANANTWTGAQTFNTSAATFNAGANFPGLGVWNSSGNVGVGTTPGNKLHVYEGNTATFDVAKFEAAGAASRILISTPLQTWKLVTGSSTEFRIDGDNTSTFYIEDGAPTDALRIKSTGNVGIGTNAASTKLHVVGGARITGLVSCDTIDTDASGNLACGTDASGSIGPGTANKVAKFTGTGTTLGDSVITESAGNIGIGTAPIARLEIQGSGNTSGTFSVGVKNSDGFYIFGIKDDGNLGLGLVNPQYRVHVLGRPSVTDYMNLLPGVGGEIRLGVGLSNPANLLGVAGAASIGATYAASAAPTNGLIVQGNVGINTTSPDPIAKLHVVEDVTTTIGIKVEGSDDILNVYSNASGPLSPVLIANDTGVSVNKSAHTAGVAFDVNGNASVSGALTSGSLNVNSNTLMTSGTSVGIGNSSPATTLDLLGSLALRSTNLNVTSGSTYNALAVPAGASFVRLTCTACISPNTVIINGIAGGLNKDGRILVLYNTSSLVNLQVAGESGAALATDRISLPGSNPQTTTNIGVFVFIYDNTTQRWRAVSIAL